MKKAEFLVEGEDGIPLDLEDLKRTIETWEDFNYRIGEVKVLF